MFEFLTYNVKALSILVSGSLVVGGPKSEVPALSTDLSSTVTFACPPNP